jgi:PAS domain S-box-containing protein
LILLGILLSRALMWKKQVATGTEDLQERAKELQCLFGVSKAILHSDTEVELLQDVVGLMPAGWSFPEFTRARIEFDGREFLSQPFSQNQCYQSAAITVGGIQRGLVEVYYVGNHPLLVTDSQEMAEGRHLVPERHLIQAIARLLSEALQAKVVERRFREKENEYETLVQSMLDGVALHEIICDEEGTPVDYRFLSVNPAFERLTGLTGEMVLGKTVREVLPNTESIWIQKYGHVALTGEPLSFEEHAEALGKYFAVTAFQSLPGRFACIFTDITARRTYEARLARKRLRLQSLASQLANAEDRLRQDIAAGLHDSIGQDLAALKLTVDIMRLNQEADAQSRKALTQVSDSIDLIVQEIWSLAFNLSPPGLYESGLVSSLEWLIGQFGAQHDIEFHLEIIAEPVALPVQMRGLLFQMIRELVVNAVKHGAAKNITIELSQEGDFLWAAVVDDGLGFDVDIALLETETSTGFGLFSIRERLAFQAGKLDIDSVVGKGTRATIHFPFRATTPAVAEI